MHSHLVEPARDLNLSDRIQKRGVPFGRFACWEKGLIAISLWAVSKSYGPPLASKMHSHLVEPARDLALSDRIQKRPLKRGLSLYGGGIGIRTLVRLLT